MLITTRDKKIRMWDTNGNQVGSVLGESGQLNSRVTATFGPKSEIVLVQSNDGPLATLWDRDGKIITESGDLKIRNVSMSVANNMALKAGGILITSIDGIAYLWDAKGNLQAPFIRQPAQFGLGWPKSEFLENGNIQIKAYDGEGGVGSTLLVDPSTVTVTIRTVGDNADLVIASELDSNEIRHLRGQSALHIPAFAPDATLVATQMARASSRLPMITLSASGTPKRRKNSRPSA